MTWLDDALADIKDFEGCRLTTYWDPLGKCWTVGYGHTGPEVHEGYVITQAKANQDLNDNFTTACSDLDKHCAWWKTAPSPVRRGLSNMSFQLGWPRLSGFENMLEAGMNGEYERMAQEALNSVWAHQVPKRAQFIANLFISASKGVAA